MAGGVSSMTGFARVDDADGPRRWTWELRSVNGRGLETRFRLPPGFDFIEPDLRKAAGEAFARGNMSASLTLKDEAAAGGFAVNRAALDAALGLIEEIRHRIDSERPRPEGVLALRGVIDTGEVGLDDEARTALGARLVASFRSGAAELVRRRREEGAALAALIEGQVDAVARLAAEARIAAERQGPALKARLAAQAAELLGAALPEERLAQEAALLAVKADVREELDRLDAHVAAARALLAEGGAAGRRLDFLTQEFNREANTLCSKAQDMGLKRIGLDLKTVIDQMREQAQNIE